jgi:hypothetical protein
MEKGKHTSNDVLTFALFLSLVVFGTSLLVKNGDRREQNSCER